MVINTLKIREVARGMKNFNKVGWQKPLLPPQTLRHTTVRLPSIMLAEFEDRIKSKFGFSSTQNGVSLLIANFLFNERGNS